MKRLACPLEQIARKFPTRLTIIDSRRKISYFELNQWIDDTAARLKETGVKPGDRTAILAQNSTEYIIVLWALWRLKAVACLLSPRTPPEKISPQLKAVNAKWLITDLKIEIQWPARKIISLNRIVQTPPSHWREFGKPIYYDLNQTVTILLTSGTSGRPKAVVQSFANHYFSAKGSNDNIRVDAKSKWLLSLPLYHVSGLSILFRCALGAGAVIVPDPKEDLATAIRKYKATHVSLVPIQLFRILQKKSGRKILSGLRAILLGGSAVPLELIRAARKFHLPVYLTYGLTEMASQVATQFVTQVVTQQKLLKYRQLKIAEDGEILVKGQTLFQGYWQKDRLVRPRTKGWFKTGDIGRLDSKGNLSVTGRKDTMFISGGENIYPEEIEKELLNYNGVRQAVVVAQADKEFGYRPVAFIDSSKKYNGAQLRKFLAKRLPRFKIPITFFPWPVKISSSLKPPRQLFPKFLAC